MRWRRWVYHGIGVGSPHAFVAGRKFSFPGASDDDCFSMSGDLLLLDRLFFALALSKSRRKVVRWTSGRRFGRLVIWGWSQRCWLSDEECRRGTNRDDMAPFLYVLIVLNVAVDILTAVILVVVTAAVTLVVDAKVRRWR